MHKRCEDSGFTIIEVMIVLALGSFMFFAVNSLLRGNQAQTEFSTGAQQIYSSLQSINSDVENGVYNVPAGYHCFVNNSNIPWFSKTHADFGCVFVGKVIEFNPYANASQYYVYTMAGDQFANVNSSNFSSPNSIGTSNPKIFNSNLYKYPPDTSPPAGTQIYSFPYGFYVKSITYSSKIGTQAGTLGLVGIFNNISNSSNSITTKLSVRVVKGSFTAKKSTSADLGTAISDINSAGLLKRDYWDYSNIGYPYAVCLVSNLESNKSAEITFEQGSNSVNLSIDIINNNTCT